MALFVLENLKSRSKLGTTPQYDMTLNIHRHFDLKLRLASGAAAVNCKIA